MSPGPLSTDTGTLTPGGKDFFYFIEKRFKKNYRGKIAYISPGLWSADTGTLTPEGERFFYHIHIFFFIYIFFKDFFLSTDTGTLTPDGGSFFSSFPQSFDCNLFFTFFFYCNIFYQQTQVHWHLMGLRIFVNQEKIKKKLIGKDLFYFLSTDTLTPDGGKIAL